MKKCQCRNDGLRNDERLPQRSKANGFIHKGTTMKKLSTVLVLLAASVVSTRAARAQDEEFYLDPLGEVVVDMQVAGGRLAKLLTDKPTQRKQEDALAKLDSLIELLERRRQQSGGGGANPSEPLDDERIVAGPGGSGPLHAPRRNGAMWGELPPHKRQEILQSMTEGFPAHYRPILERYYRRLADESPAGEATDDAAATTTPETTPAGESAAAGNAPLPTNPGK